MTGAEPWSLFVLPLGLGLFGFVEPCSLGSTLLFVKVLEDKGRAAKIAETMIFALTRGLVIGALGVAAVLLGSAFAPLQKGVWVGLGLAYAVLGMLLLAGYGARVMVPLGVSLSRLGGRRASAGLGALFGLNIPACAAPLLAVLLGTAAAGGASGGTLAAGFVSLAVFGLALSLPLVVAVLFEPARAWLERLARWGSRYPRWAGLVLLLLGAWSIRFGLAVG